MTSTKEDKYVTIYEVWNGNDSGIYTEDGDLLYETPAPKVVLGVDLAKGKGDYSI